MFTAFRTHYLEESKLLPESPTYRWLYLISLFALIVIPFFLSDYALTEISLFFIYSGIGLSLIFLTGFTGMVSLGHTAFLAIGAYSHCLFLNMQWDFISSLGAATLLTCIAGFLLSFPLSKLHGIYLSIATLALAVIVQELAVRAKSLTGGLQGTVVPEGAIVGFSTHSPTNFYWICAIPVALTLILLLNLFRSNRGRSFLAIRDSELSGTALGINISRTKTLSFTLSAGIAGFFGCLLAHQFQYLTPDLFSPILSIQLLLMIIVGGLNTFHGAFLGALVLLQIPQFLMIAKDYLPPKIAAVPGLEPGVFGLILIGFILLEPAGVYGRLLKIRNYWEVFPLQRKNNFYRQNLYNKTQRVH